MIRPRAERNSENRNQFDQQRFDKLLTAIESLGYGVNEYEARVAYCDGRESDLFPRITFDLTQMPQER